ncbi:MAG: nucleotidyltransferase domain-containing protein [Oscillospiraceae bacterium]|nr:nucleotidyltransferase domain-containing protein [Oscillospiraceae bacterium]
MLSIEELKSYIIPVVEKHPVERVILFGSYARGDASETSDVDLVVESGGKMRNSKIFTLGGDLLAALPVRVDVYDILEIKESSPLYNSIVEDGITIYETATQRAV